MRVFRCSKSTRDASDYSKYGTYGHHVTTILIFSRAVTEILCLHFVDSRFEIVCAFFFCCLNCSTTTVVAFVSFVGTEKRRGREKSMSSGFMSSVCTLLLFSSSFVHFSVEKPFLILLLTVSFIGWINALFTNYQLKAVCSTNTMTLDTQVNWLFSLSLCVAFLRQLIFFPVSLSTCFVLFFFPSKQ